MNADPEAPQGAIAARATPATPVLNRGKLDGSTFSQIEDALDRVEAPIRDGDSGPWLTLVERIEALAAKGAADDAAGGHHGLDTAERVCFYEQDFYVLSNFSSFNLQWEGHTFATSEHAYHWSKFAAHHEAWNAGGSIATQVRNAASAHAAFKIAEGNKSRRRPDWDEVKVDIMRNILRAKAAQHEYVRRKLLATGDRELVENSWRDDFWGWGPNRDGRNMLGKLWMEVRAELRSKASDKGDAA